MTTIPSWYVEKPFPFSMKGWVSVDERRAALGVLYEIIPDDSHVLVAQDEIFVEIILGNNELTHEGWADEISRRINVALQAKGLKNVIFGRVAE